MRQLVNLAVIAILVAAILLLPQAFGQPMPGAKEFVSEFTGAKFVLIPAGTFTMGSPPTEPGRGKDETQHQVTISKPFYMQTTEVTQGQWLKVMGSNPSYFRNCGSDCPVENVSWNDVQDFIKKLNGQEKTNKYRLPTEAEWEYAARAGTADARYGEIDSIAWYNGNAGTKTHPAGRMQPNAWGLYDMLGNVWEWCQDRYGEYQSGGVTDPVGSSFGSLRVNRGGSWEERAIYVRAAGRYSLDPGAKRYSIGFRLLRTAYVDSRITVQELKAKMDKGEDIVILDVRTGREYEDSKIKIKGAVRIPLVELESRSNELPKDKEIIAYCT
jgi:formylglycine-generating enzyme required for sulfatase activity